MTRAIIVAIVGMIAGIALVAFATTNGAPTGPLNVTINDAPFDGPDGGASDALPGPDGGFEASICNPQTAFLCGQPGTNGCAGYGAEGGVGGQGGGAAIPLYIIGNSHVTMSNGAFFVRNGGAGGPGGDGGVGSGGHNGNMGGATQCFASCDINCNPQGGSSLQGGAAGNGANGGNGGLGGGGAGGPIYFYAAIDAAPPTITPSTFDASMIVADGGPGAGGSPNGKPGAAGVGYP